MAGDWLKVEKDTPEKPEIMALATILSVSVADAFLGCFKLWRWADSQTVDGYVSRVTTAALDALCGLPGFADALREVGWLQVRNGSLEVPNFSRHMGQPAKARGLAAARMKRHRTPALPNCDAPSVTEPSPEKRREELGEESPNTPLAGEPPTPPPRSPTSSEFLEAWNAVQGFTHAREFGKKRQKAFKARCKDAAWVRDWREALAKAAQKPFCLGHNDRNWIADVDWFLRPDVVAKLMEGNYLSNGKAPTKPPETSAERMARVVSQRAQAAREAAQKASPEEVQALRDSRAGPGKEQGP